MSFPDIVPDLKASMPELRGTAARQPVARIQSWFRVGGPAQALFMPEDEDDLAYFLQSTPADIPVTVIGAGSNLIVRDGGVPGVVIRLGRGFNDIAVEEGHRVRGRHRRCSMSCGARSADGRHRRARVSTAAFPVRSAARCA